MPVADVGGTKNKSGVRSKGHGRTGSGRDGYPWEEERTEWNSGSTNVNQDEWPVVCSLG